MIVLAALLAVASACDLPFLCFKMEESIKTNENVYLELQIVENKIDILDKKLDRILLSTRLHSTLLFIDMAKYDVSEVYEDRIYLATKTLARFDIDAANEACKSQGGYLLEIDDNEERMFTWDFAEHLGNSPHFAAGGNDIQNEGTWVYYHSGKPVPADLVWVPGRPNNAGGNEDCMAFWMARGGLNDIPCNNPGIKFICEIPLRKV